MKTLKPGKYEPDYVRKFAEIHGAGATLTAKILSILGNCDLLIDRKGNAVIQRREKTPA